MRILIDADGCPVVDITIKIANETSVPCFIFCDTSHVFEKQGAVTITVSKGSDSVDFAIVNMIKYGDIIITQDYGLAAMCLSRRAIIISQDGMEYTGDNIDSLLLQRHTSREIRMSGGKLKVNKKRTKLQDINFEKKLREFIKQNKEIL